jgi:cell division protein FtsW (lipid II flippase)
MAQTLFIYLVLVGTMALILRRIIGLSRNSRRRWSNLPKRAMPPGGAAGPHDMRR